MLSFKPERSTGNRVIRDCRRENDPEFDKLADEIYALAMEHNISGIRQWS